MIKKKKEEEEEFEWTWQTNITAPIQKIEFSPNEKYFVSIEENSIFAKVWMNYMSGYEFELLTHASTVEDFEWCLSERLIGNKPAVLMTKTKRENYRMIWSETIENESLNFYVIGVVEATPKAKVGFLPSPHEKCPNDILLQTNQVEERGHQQSQRGEMTDGLIKSSINQNAESTNFIYIIEEDGSLSIQCIYGITDMPRHTPKLEVLKHLPNLCEKNMLNAQGVQVFFTQSSTIGGTSITIPTMLTIYALHPTGSLENFTLDMTSDTVLPPTQINIFTGHGSNIRCMTSHDSLPLVASLDEDNYLIIWHVRESAYYVPKDVLTNIELKKVEKQIYDMKWHCHEPILFMKTAQGVEVCAIRSEKPSKHNLQDRTYESTIFPPFPSYYSIQQVTIEYENEQYTDIIPNSLDMGTEKSLMTILDFHDDEYLLCINEHGHLLLFEMESHSEQITLKKVFEKSSIEVSDIAHIKASVFANYFVILMATNDGKLHGYFLSKKKNNWVLEKELNILKKKIQGSIDLIKISENGIKVGLVAKEDPKTLIILEGQSSFSRYLRETTLTFDERIHSLSFFTFMDGKYLLSVGLETSVECFIPCYDYTTDKNWQHVSTHVGDQLKDGCQNILITQKKTMVVSSKNSLHVFTKWDGSEDATQSFAKVVLENNYRLPDYHPLFLQYFYTIGDFQLVKRVFCYLGTILQEKFGCLEPKRKEQIVVPPLGFDFFKSLLKSENIFDDIAKQRRIPTSIMDKYKTIESDSDSDSDYFDDDFDVVEKKPSIEEKVEVKEEEEEEDTLDFQSAYETLIRILPKINIEGLSEEDHKQLILLIKQFHARSEKPENLDSAAFLYYAVFELMKDDIVEYKMPQNCVAWAFHSTTQDELWGMILEQIGERNITWTILKNLGVTYWVRHLPLLNKIGEILATSQFASKNNPEDAALVYLALSKKDILIRLFESKGEAKVAKFLKRDFSTNSQNSVKAAKNGYKLLGQHRFSYAAAFFILSHCYKDAFKVILSKLDDTTFAFFICRLLTEQLEDDSFNFRQWLLDDYILLKAKKYNNYWIEHLDLWLQQKYEASFKALTNNCNANQVMDYEPNIVLYCTMIKNIAESKRVTIEFTNQDKIQLQLANFHFYALTRNHLHGLHTIHILEELIQEEIENPTVIKKKSKSSTAQQQNINSGTINMSMMSGMMMGGMNPMMMAQMNPMMMAQMNQAKTPTVKKEEPKSNEDDDDDEPMDYESIFIWLKSLKHAECLILLSQHLTTCSNAIIEDQNWEKSTTEFTNEFTYLINDFKCDREAIVRDLYIFCRLNGLIVGRCLLANVNNENGIDHLSQICERLSSSVSLINSGKVSTFVLNSLKRFTKELVICVDRYKAVLTIAATLKADISIVIFSLLFIICYETENVEALQALFTHHEVLSSSNFNHSEQKPSSLKLNNMTATKFHNCVYNNISIFYSTFNQTLLEILESQQADKLLAEDELEKEKSQNHMRYLKLKRMLYNQQSQLDAQSSKLKVQYHKCLLNSLTLITFLTYINKFITNIYTTYEEPLSRSAQTLISCISLKKLSLEEKLKHLELEILSNEIGNGLEPIARSELLKATSINVRSTNMHLSNLVDTLISSVRKKRRSIELQRSKSVDHFSSLAHIMPSMDDDHDQKNFAFTILEDPSAMRMFMNDEHMKEAQRELLKFYATLFNLRFEIASNAANDTPPKVVVFNHLEIARINESLRAFCINPVDNNQLAFSTSKTILESDIEQSIRFRKRNESLERLIDEEPVSWEASISRGEPQDATTGARNSLLSPQFINFMSNFEFTSNTPPQVASDSPPLQNDMKGVGSDKFFPKPSTSRGFLSTLRLNKRQKHDKHHQTSYRSSTRVKHFRKMDRRSSKQHVDHGFSASVLTAHPYLPFYLSGAYDGSIQLWQFREKYAVRTYQNEETEAITRIKFSDHGNQYASSDAAGNLKIWRFEPSKDSIRESKHLHEQDYVVDFSFIGDSKLATIGITNSMNELIIYDLLLPKSGFEIYRLYFDMDCASILYVPNFNLIIIGAEDGMIHIVDCTQLKLLSSIQLSNNRRGTIVQLALDSCQEFFVVGTNEGDIVLFDLEKTLATSHSQSLIKDSDVDELILYQDTSHAKRKALDNIFNISVGSGVTNMIVTSSSLITSGNDGRILRRCLM